MNAVARPAALFGVAVALVAGLTGCRTNPGAAALVGDHRISVDLLQSEVSAALADPQAASLAGDRASFTRTALARLIQDEIIASAAARHHVTVTRSDIDTQINEFAQQAGGLEALQQSAAQSGIAKNKLRTFMRYYVLEQKLGDALVADVPVSQSDLEAAYEQNIDRYDTVHAAHILVDSKTQADSLLAQVRADPSSFPELAAKFSTDTGSATQGGDLGSQAESQFVPAFGHAIFRAEPDSFIEVHTRFGWHVVHVISHDTTPLSKVTDELKAAVLKSSRDRLLAQALNQEARRLGVHVNPRYGKWDAQQSIVVELPVSRDVSSPSPAPSG